MGEEENPVTEYVFDLINRMNGCQELAVENMDLTRSDRKRCYDRDAVKRTFKTGDKVLELGNRDYSKLSLAENLTVDPLLISRHY